MTAVLLAVAGIAVAGEFAFRAGRNRAVRLPGGAGEPARPISAQNRAALAAIGSPVRRAAGRPPASERDAAVGRTLLIVVALVAMAPGLVVLWLPAATIGWVVRRRAAARRAERARHRCVLEVVDLYAVALLSGHNVANATRHVRHWVGPTAAPAMVWCCDQIDRGRPVADVIEQLPDRLGSPVRPLVTALLANERYGAPVLETLTLLAADSRRDERRRAEASARGLPVTMLFPLVVCVLPAFLLLTVVPVVADALTTFRW